MTSFTAPARAQSFLDYTLALITPDDGHMLNIAIFTDCWLIVELTFAFLYVI